MYIPFNYQQINEIYGHINPSQIQPKNSAAFAFWERSLFQRAFSILEFELPENWEGDVKDFFLYCLFAFGKICISKNTTYGQFFQPCSLSGYDFYYRPTIAQISNPLFSANLEIGKECEILKLCPDYNGIYDIIYRYALKLSELDSAADMAIINSKMAYILGAKNKAAAEALKKIYDKMQNGEPLIVTDIKMMDDQASKTSPLQIFERKSIKESYITSNILQDIQTVLNEFDTEIGIPALPYQKKERMVTSEAESKIIDATSRSLVWYETLSSSIKKIKKLYPDIKLSVKLRYNPESMGGESDVISENNINRDE